MAALGAVARGVVRCIPLVGTIWYLWDYLKQYAPIEVVVRLLLEADTDTDRDYYMDRLRVYLRQLEHWQIKNVPCKKYWEG